MDRGYTRGRGVSGSQILPARSSAPPSKWMGHVGTIVASGK